MISQSDIIRTLVNKNCTDEAIMSTALSPNCTLAKLLEKFAEAERFDLALDVSMKLGLDTAPLWRTWAMRCLKNRNFQAAREKFKFCFQRLRHQPGRSSSSSLSSRLLSEMLNDLARMPEKELTLTEEVEQILRQDFGIKAEGSKQILGVETIREKPMIYKECVYYLEEYGSIKDKVDFYTKHQLWNSLIKILIDNRVSLGTSKYFMTDVFLRSASFGHLDDLISEFLKLDPNLKSSRQYFQTVYESCSSQRRYNLLKYLQYTIGDFVAVAETEINHFFLRKPARNYKELYHRLTSLTKAIENYRKYLKKLGDKKHTISMKNDLKRKDVVKNDLFSEMSYFNVEVRISTIELQIDITKNFYLNEVSGCMSEIEPAVGQTTVRPSRVELEFPVTVFDRSERRKIFLVALVLIYFDPECSCYFSSGGHELAKRLIQKLQLNKLDVYKTAMRIILEDDSCDLIENTSRLLDRLQQDYEDDKKLMTKSPANLPMHRLSLKPIQQKPPQQQPVPPTVRYSSQESEKLSILSNDSTSSSITTTSSSSATSSYSPLTSRTSQTGSLIQPQLVVSAPDRIRSQQAIPIAPGPASEPQVLRVSPQLLATSPTPTPSLLSLPVAPQPPPLASSPLLTFQRKNSTPKLFSTAPLAAALPSDDHGVAKKNAPNKVIAIMGSHHAQNSTSTTTTTTTTGTNSLETYASAQDLCDEVIRDSIKCCREPDYKMELTKLLSSKAKIELYIELGKLSYAQRLACSLNLSDYVMKIIEEAEKLNQNHVKTVCQHWLAKHESSQEQQ